MPADSQPGTPSFENWKAFLAERPALGAVEFLLYSDAWLVADGEQGLGPVQIFNLVPVELDRGQARPRATLRLSLHAPFEMPQMKKTDTARFHGGTMADEIAALVSLLCGVRLRVGAQTRLFGPGEDEKGRPIFWEYRPAPAFTVGHSGVVLPSARGQRSLEAAQKLSSFPTLSPEDAIALARAARLYQDALWVAESASNLAWLMLVSAVETAANRWKRANDSPVARLRFSRSEFADYLESVGGAQLIEKVADEFGSSIGATKKFVEFLLRFLPDPPEKRPPRWCQVDWSKGNLSAAFKKIYGHRSRALHDGISFPSPMCSPPLSSESLQTVSERPQGTAASEAGATWLARDYPMHLHVFEYIARSAITAWWESLSGQVEDPRSTLLSASRSRSQPC